MSTTCTGIRIANSADAELVIEAVRLGHLPICKTRLSHAQCCEIRPGDVYVWIETPDNVATGTTGLARWTDGHKWTTSKWKNDSLIYMEVLDPGIVQGSSVCNDSPRTVSDAHQPLSQNDSDKLIKQCYSIICDPFSEQRTHWHLIAYFSVASRPLLQSVQSGHLPCLLNITVPSGQYVSYRKFKADQRQYSDAGQSWSDTSSSSSAAELSTAAQSDTLPPLSLVVSLSRTPTPKPQPGMTSLGPSLISASRQSTYSSKARSDHSTDHPPPTSLLLPLTQLHGTHLVQNRSEFDRLHVAALDGCRSSISQLPSSHIIPASPVTHARNSAVSPCSRCVSIGRSSCLQCGQT